MLYYDPSECIKGLQQLLISDKKKIAFLYGAGTSILQKTDTNITVPAVKEMTNKVELKLASTAVFSTAIKQIKEEIGEDNYNIESLLSNVEEKWNIIGKGKLNGLDKDGFDGLVGAIKNNIRELVSVHKNLKTKEDIENLIHVDFAEWICRAERKYPVEIFTTNYDYLFEIGLEARNVPYYDGFTGSFKPFFNSDSIEDLNLLSKQTKLWKIHGSLGWHLDEDKRVLRSSSDKDDILIYPSILKYANSKKQPYVALMDRLTNFLKEPDSVLFVCGYSFGDEHINERILTALNTNTTAHVFVLYYDIYYENNKKSYSFTEDCFLAKLAKANSKLSILGCRYAVLGCQYYAWKLKREPDKEDTININLYFDEDAPINSKAEISKEKIGEEEWTGLGELLLPNFTKFVMFLKSMIYEDFIREDKNERHTD